MSPLRIERYIYLGQQELEYSAEIEEGDFYYFVVRVPDGDRFPALAHPMSKGTEIYVSEPSNYCLT